MFILPELPFDKDALEPHISEETLEFHYWKHHATYVENLNKLSKWTEYENMDLVEIIVNSDGALFNNAAQVYNHTFYWNCLSPTGWWEPIGVLAEKIDLAFWSYAQFMDKFSTAAISNFWSGWTWLVKNRDGDLEILSTTNAETPLTTEMIPLLTIDVWEHAYYIDYRNARPKYVENFWNLVNWKFVENNMNT